MGLRSVSWGFGMIALVGCGPAVGDADDEGTTSAGSTTSVGESTVTVTTAGTTIDPSTTMPATSADTTTSADDEASDEDTPPDLVTCAAPSCSGTSYACTNGRDDDGDGRVDLQDPECVSVCDDDEAAFWPRLPGDGFTCMFDCYFDGNGGSGDDLCEHDVECDEENPGASIGCEYVPGNNNCPASQPPASEMCIDFCAPLVLPGCDCFGCCTFTGPDGDVDLFLDSGPDCRLDNLAGCQPCTSRIEECGNPCAPDGCEICIGGSMANTCRTNTCDVGTICSSQDDCACDEACLLGCCLPLPPG